MQTDTHRQARIHQLDHQLANQIAAGEVVERPASVVKELLENAIDAGASRIEIDIERGGTRLIRITDNGCGIVKEDLTLALSRHATSKISRTEDLAAILSLGFRGEALASIASVSRMILTSRTDDSDLAWQAIAEGRDMAVKVQPASATVGTRIEVRDLFYNTPARQKFLRAEKTEFAHIEEIFKRHALVNYSTAFILKHNHKVVRRIPAAKDPSDYLRRIENICGKPFAQNAIEFSCNHDLINLKGWTGGAAYHRSESDIQYVFVNGRPVKDKMLNHAIRQAFQDQLPAGRMPTFVMFLQIDPQSIDVNVHPTKHEIRFDQQRMVHDLIVHSIAESMIENNQSLAFDQPVVDKSVVDQASQAGQFEQPSNANRQPFNGVGYSQARYASLAANPRSSDFSANQNRHNREYQSSQQSPSESAYQVADSNSAQSNSSIQSNSRVVTIGKQTLLVFADNSSYLVQTQTFFKQWISQALTKSQPLPSQALLFAKNVVIENSLLEQLEVNQTLQQMGFVFSPDKKNQVSLKQTPQWLCQLDNQAIVKVFLKWCDVINLALDSFEPQSTEFKQTDLLNNALSEVLNPYAENIIDWLVCNGERLRGNLASVELTDDSVKKLFR